MKKPSGKGARLGRGNVAAKFTGGSLGPRSRRVVIKSRVVILQGRGRQSTLDAEDYVQREGVEREGGPGRLYGAHTDAADGDAFATRCENDRHQFRFIVSPEDATDLDDLKSYTRALMGQMERDLGTRLDWVAVDHWDTEDPHTHILLRGKSQNGHDLVIARDYISHGMRARASEIATQWLGPRTELEIRESQQREVQQDRWTGLDRAIQRESNSGVVDLRVEPKDMQARFRRSLMIGRLGRLSEMGLASRLEPGVWSVAPQAEATLRAMGERGDIIRTMQRAFAARDRDHVIFDPTQAGARIVGRVASKGLVDELHERGYLIVDGIDGRAHYVALPSTADLTEYVPGSIVTVRAGGDPRPADRNIKAFSDDGIYRVQRHLAHARAHERNPDAYIEAHVRRLESLRRAGIVERLEEGVWRVPSDVVDRGREYDAKRVQGPEIEVRSHVPVRDQVRANGATWLDRQLVGQTESLAPRGFGAEVRRALSDRESFLVEHKLAERRGQRLILIRNLLETLRARDIERAAQSIEAETGLQHRPVGNGQSVSGTYAATVNLVSGRFAMLEDGLGFSLVPWRQVLEKRLGQSMTALVRGEQVSWNFGRQRDISL